VSRTKPKRFGPGQDQTIDEGHLKKRKKQNRLFGKWYKASNEETRKKRRANGNCTKPVGRVKRV